ncbi:TolC family protein [Armatimonas sp.]|uniref:TolC family protein n=1 Tax=Armatimonas sp. TaxID=1872638 RepID=UPI00286B104F|nr:TolC family protein [Armatimonas sp.]
MIPIPTAHVLVQETPALTLTQARQRAVERHAQLARAKSQVQQAQTRVTQAQAAEKPSVFFQAVASRGPTGAPAFGPLNNPGLSGVPPQGLAGIAGDPLKKQFGASLNLQQTFLDGGRTKDIVASRALAAEAAGSEVRVQQAQVLLLVDRAYLAVLRAERKIQIAQESLRQRETVEQQAKLFSESGLKSGVDAQLALASVAEARGALSSAKSERLSATAALNHAMGETNLTEWALTLPKAETLPQTLTAALERATRQRPELTGVGLLRQSAEAAAASLKKEFRPRLDGIASIGALNPGPLIRNNQLWAVGLAMTVPLSTGGAIEGRIAEEQRRAEAAESQARELREQVRLEVTQAWLEIEAKTALLEAATAQVMAAETARTLAQERYKLQLNTLVELTDAEAQALRARLLVVGAEYELALARATLHWALGEAK